MTRDNFSDDKLPSSSLPLSKKVGTGKVSYQAQVSKLPSSYGKTVIVILPRDPSWLFAYWEISNDKREEIKKRFGDNIWHNSQIMLRVYDVTGVKFNGTNANGYFDIPINNQADNWYINTNATNRDYCVDIGIKIPDGTFILLARSNIVSMPRHGVSPVTDEQWAVLQSEFEKILKLSGIDQIGKSSSFDIAKALIERWRYMVSVSSVSISSFGISSWSRRQERVLEEEKKVKQDFWLKANTELIIYGTTEPDAELIIGDQKVQLSNDGSFSIRIGLTDGVHEIPIKAKSHTKKLSKEIAFTISRKTEQK